MIHADKKTKKKKNRKEKEKEIVVVTRSELEERERGRAITEAGRAREFAAVGIAKSDCVFESPIESRPTHTQR